VDLAVADALFRRHPDDDEGVLSARRAAIVSSVGLARLAGRIDLGADLLLGEGEAQLGGRARPSLLASALEAVVGALYLDIGYDATRDWLLGIATPEIEADLPARTLKSPKSRLQEMSQHRSGVRPVYMLVDVSGPDHRRTFRISVSLEGRELGVGEGPSRRIAETAAAAQAIDVLEGEVADRSDDLAPADAPGDAAPQPDEPAG
jgi:ribonuclease-3